MNGLGYTTIIEPAEALARRRGSVGLVLSLASIGAGFYLYEVLKRVTVHFIQQPEDIVDAVMGIAFVFPIFLVLQLGGFGLLIYIVTFWRGKPETGLLLRLLEDSRDDA